MSSKTGFLADIGSSLISNGYNIVPVPQGSKSPGFDGWQNTKATPAMLKQWVEGAHANSGIGILTKNNPAIDLDIYDEEVAKLMQDWCEMNIGPAPVRVGRAPKRLLVFRTDEPFSKMKTGKYEDEWGDKHEIEILGNGQQFIGYGIHKDTHRPYEWITPNHLSDIHTSDLTALTVEDAKALMEHFVEVANARGWKKVSNGIQGHVKPDNLDDPFADAETTVDISIDELRNKLLLVPGAEDHDVWVQIGMALYHQFSGDEDGLALWHEWSETADNYDAEVLDKRWKSFAIEGKRRAPITARTILKLAKEAATTLVVQRAMELRDAFTTAKDESEWREACRMVKQSDLDQLARAQLADIAKDRFKDITGAKISIATVRKELEYELPTRKNTPQWCKGWVFNSSNDTFFHVSSKTEMSITGFNAVYSRYALSKQDIQDGKMTPSHSPFELAMNMYTVPTVEGIMYLPGEEIVFKYNGKTYANLYNEGLVPETPKELSPAGKMAIRTVKAHIAHLLENEDEQRLFTDWLAWIVQNPGKRMNWAMLLQGVEGDGKSFFGMLLYAVMGGNNVKTLNATVLETDFTGWAHGQCVLVVEEPRLHGHNKYDVINKIKPFITNKIVSIHAKGRDPFDVENTTSFFMPTNFKDALPINDNDRRYCVLFSKWQSRDALRAFREENPRYYTELYATIENHQGALRKWLIEHIVDDDFPAGGDAPVTVARQYMIASTTPEILTAIDEIIAEGVHPEASEDLINITALMDILIGRDVEIPQTHSLKRVLEQGGYTYIGRVRIDPNGPQQRVWSKKPGVFMSGNVPNIQAIRKSVKDRQAAIEENTL